MLVLARRLGLAPSTPDGQSRLLIVPAGAGAWAGFVVRPSVRVLRLPLPHRPCRRVPPVDQALVRGVMELKGETLVIPNLRRVLDVNG